MKRALLMILFMALSACGGGKPDTLVEGGYSETEMADAIARARKEVDTFIATLESRDGSDFAVKAPIQDGVQTEHFWLTDLSYQAGEFEGKIGNEPGIVSNVSFGQIVKVRKEDISDWLFMRGGKMHGNYTIRPLFATMPQADADYYRSMLAEP
jgi:uncharacterized protein YegJ (DUF2314 family)